MSKVHCIFLIYCFYENCIHCENRMEQKKKKENPKSNQKFSYFILFPLYLPHLNYIILYVYDMSSFLQGILFSPTTLKLLYRKDVRNIIKKLYDFVQEIIGSFVSFLLGKSFFYFYFNNILSIIVLAIVKEFVYICF